MDQSEIDALMKNAPAKPAKGKKGAVPAPAPAPEPERAKIRGLTSQKLFAFS